MNRLEGKVAIVTGAGRGLGLAVAELFASEGAKVVGTGRHVEKVEKAFAAVLGGHPEYEMRAMQHEITRKDEWEQVVAATVEQFGHVDILTRQGDSPFVFPKAQGTRQRSLSFLFGFANWTGFAPGRGLRIG